MARRLVALCAAAAAPWATTVGFWVSMLTEIRALLLCGGVGSILLTTLAASLVRDTRRTSFWKEDSNWVLRRAFVQQACEGTALSERGWLLTIRAGYVAFAASCVALLGMIIWSKIYGFS